MRYNKSTFLLAAVLILFVAAAAMAGSGSPPYALVQRSIDGITESVYDGDTLQVITPEGTKLRVRLAWIDAPETAKPQIPGQPYGREAAEYLRSLVLGRTVTVHIVDTDRYRRMVAVVTCGEENINEAMIAAGMAEAYREYLVEPYKTKYLTIEGVARQKQYGIWSQSDYIRPSEFRKNYKIR